MSRSSKWSKEEDEWIIENYANRPKKEVVEEFENKFHRGFGRVKIYSRAKKLNVRIADYHKYTEEEAKFISDNCSLYSRSVLTRIFNEKFGLNISEDAFRKYCSEKGYPLCENPRPYRATKRKDVNTSVFKKDKGWLIKISDEPYANRKNWVNKSRYLYEKYIGEIPEGYVVAHIDGDVSNCNLDNLIAVNRYAGTYLYKIGIDKTYDFDSRKTAFILSELDRTIRSLNNNG